MPPCRSTPLPAVLRAGAIAAAVGLAPGGAKAEPAAALRALAEATLAGLQAKSFAGGWEYCGFIMRDPDGRLRATPPRQGDARTCLPEAWGGGDIVASYHTHGAYSPDDWGEVPSDMDLEGDFAMGVDGFIATPGGRLWWVNPHARRAELLCGPGCLPVDPAFEPGAERLAHRYTLTDLRRLFND